MTDDRSRSAECVHQQRRTRTRVSVIFGTRPEAIKLAPVVVAMARDDRFECEVCVTAQHREMLDQVLKVFDIVPTVDLDLMKPNQSLASLTARSLVGIDECLAEHRPDLLLVQGDTTTALCAAMAGFYRNIPIGHVEAGLRTGNLRAPWPEEANRVLISRLASVHFAPTTSSRDNLLREGISADRVHVTGNTVVDALMMARDLIDRSPPFISELPDFLQPNATATRMVLITGHRRENFGEGFENICRAIAELAKRAPEAHFVYAVHLNPNVREPVYRILRGSGERSGRDNIHLIEPLDYLRFVALMNRAYFILTDSGGIQEEAPSLGKPVLVMRDVTERPEGVRAGTVRLVGTSAESIVQQARRLLEDRAAYRSMSDAHNPYGDGAAASRIIEVCAGFAGEVAAEGAAT